MFSIVKVTTAGLFDLFRGQLPASAAASNMPESLLACMIKATQYGVKAGMDVAVRYRR